MVDTAKIFWSGRSQAVRLPKQFRFADDEVTIVRRDDGAIVLKPIGAGVPTSPTDAAAAAIDRLRSAIRDGMASGDPAPWSADEIKSLARGG